MADQIWDPSENANEQPEDIHTLFAMYDSLFFEEKLGTVRLEWSKRMTLCAGICYYNEGNPIIRLSERILKFRPFRDVKETLLHEMIHAFLYVTCFVDTREDHGDNFKFHMNHINKITGLNLTIFHNFHDEVDNCRQHIWRCNGVCQKWKPYYGYCKRAVNRAPSDRDPWFKRHKLNCGGSFEKISEPEPAPKKKRSQTTLSSSKDDLKKGSKRSKTSKDRSRSPRRPLSHTPVLDTNKKITDYFNQFKHTPGNSTLTTTTTTTNDSTYQTAELSSSSNKENSRTGISKAGQAALRRIESFSSDDCSQPSANVHILDDLFDIVEEHQEEDGRCSQVSSHRTSTLADPKGDLDEQQRQLINQLVELGFDGERSKEVVKAGRSIEHCVNLLIE
mmetsp:Transcript_19779/g.22435  ORF Transcript_19779/g.22435 Transcript_19779/m.22435 type:complete len:391 (-) Transcript_19779:24-1196(-)